MVHNFGNSGQMNNLVDQILESYAVQLVVNVKTNLISAMSKLTSGKYSLSAKLPVRMFSQARLPLT